MMSPVADELARRGVDVTLISLAELRGFDTPRADKRLRRAIPLNVRRRPSQPSDTTTTWRPGTFAQRAVWKLALGPRMRQMLAGTPVIVVPNDAVYPYIDLLAQVRARGGRTVLMQEGIRFPLPAGFEPYGGGATAAVCAWGEGSKDHFVRSGVDAGKVAVTGAPRLDDLDPSAWRGEGEKLLAKHRISAPPVAFLSNPIEIQGYGTKELKLDLFARFLAEAGPILRQRGVPVIVKNHPYEPPGDYARVAAASPIPELVTVIGSESIFATLAAARAAIVLTSTVGLEALTFGLPLGVVDIPGHGCLFEYVQRGAAVPLSTGTMADGITSLLTEPRRVNPAGERFVQRHLHDRGRARFNVADVIQRVIAS